MTLCKKFLKVWYLIHSTQDLHRNQIYKIFFKSKNRVSRVQNFKNMLGIHSLGCLEKMFKKFQAVTRDPPPLRLGRVDSMVCRTAMTVCGGGGGEKRPYGDPTQKKRPKRKKETQIPKKRPKHKKETQTHKRDSNSCKRPKVMKRRPKSSS